MRYISTRGGDAALTFKDTVLTGLARDGGLVLPEEIPSVADELDRLARMRYQELASDIIGRFATDIPLADLRSLSEKSYSTFRHPEIAPVVQVGDLHILELFHGPTFAFKDLALQFLGNLFEYVLDERGGRLNIVTATSGDTGSAAIYGVRGRRNVSIFVLHPAGRVSPVQALQMTSVIDPAVHNIAVRGTFDDCQGIVKALFADLPFKDSRSLGAMNSINWARVMAQVVYYFNGAFRVMERTGAGEVDFTVPTGNFGDVFAGYIAAKMGLPIRRLVIATNENDILDRCFRTGTYERRGVAATLSPSMDIQVASNFERWLFFHYGRDAAKTRDAMERFARHGSLKLCDGPVGDRWLASGSADTAETLDAIRRTWLDYGYLIDPHTAVGVAVAGKTWDRSVPMICLSTAHPAKFGAAIERAVGEDIAHHPVLDALKGAETRLVEMPADVASIRDYISANT